MNYPKIISSLFIISLFTVVQGFAQQKQSLKQKEADYLRVVTERADKIVATLAIPDSVKYRKVRQIIAFQYRDLNAIHEMAAAERQALEPGTKEISDTEVKNIEAAAHKKLSRLHKKYLEKLSKELDPQQIEMVKDGMTYRVLPITYKGYQEMLPNLTDEQKKKILQYLIEARELAMDAGSSEKKHAWFGKYKGKINNYLSAEGIDMKRASKDWALRLKAAN